MVERNSHQKWGDRVGMAYREQLRIAKESNAVPYGQERLTPSEAKTRIENMSVAERKKFIQDNGRDEVLQMLGGK